MHVISCHGTKRPDETGNLMWATTYIRGDVIQNGQAL